MLINDLFNLPLKKDVLISKLDIVLINSIMEHSKNRYEIKLQSIKSKNTTGDANEEISKILLLFNVFA